MLFCQKMGIILKVFVSISEKIEVHMSFYLEQKFKEFYNLTNIYQKLIGLNLMINNRKQFS